MSSPEQKAKELVEGFMERILITNSNYNAYNANKEHPIDVRFAQKAAKACALICVEEIIKEIDRVDGYEYDFSDEQGLSATKQDRLNFWQKVKEKINDLK